MIEHGSPVPAAPRRLVILAEGNFGFHHGKTAVGVIRYGPDDVRAVIDSTQAGGNVSSILPGRDIPIVATFPLVAFFSSTSPGWIEVGDGPSARSSERDVHATALTTMEPCLPAAAEPEVAELPRPP